MNISLPITNTDQKNTILTILRAFFASVAISLCASIAIPLPFSPVPLVIQNTLVLMIAYKWGHRFALAALSFWVLQGVLGAPVFALGKSGFWHLLGPSGGYIAGYFLAACVTSHLRRKSAFLAYLSGNMAIYLTGWAVLSLYLGVSQAFMLGVLPFIGIDLIKTLAASYLLPTLVSQKG